MVKWLCVAEKPSIAKSITQILSGGQFTTRDAARPKWIKNYGFSFRMGPGGGHTDFTVTAVAGHLTSNDFDDEFRKWRSCEPIQLFDARVRTFTNQDPDQRGIEQNLMREARSATHLMIWTDCDREGEFIGSVVAEVCRKAKPNIVVKRARFSAIIPAQINHAARNPVDLDMRQAQAVAARMELDLRVGSIFTRVQTLELQRRIAAVEESLVSYGPCQFPTLGFVVDQYERVRAFVPEPFWYIHVGLAREDAMTSFSWRRGRLYDRDVAEAVFSIVEDAPSAMVTKWETKPTQKWKPLPLTTVELQKSGSRLLRMTPKRVLEIAEALYQRGILSYPRTETDQFDREFNFHELIEKHTGDSRWGTFAQSLLTNDGFERPRNGKKNDKAHPPIHPTAHVNNLAGEEKSVYELIVRRFLGCCSKNARGLETTVEIDIAGEGFSAKGLVIRERNYLEVYIYDKWTGNHLPEFAVGEHFESDELALKEGQTSQPSLLTEADLVSLMDKNEIGIPDIAGTDATIAEHISKIIDRQYVMKQREGAVEYLVPSTLGIGLVKAYDALGLDNSLSKPHLRRLTERRLVQICEGTRTKAQVVTQSLNEYRDVFDRTRALMGTFVATVREYVEGTAGQAGPGRGVDGRAGAAGNAGAPRAADGDSDDSDDSDGGVGAAAAPSTRGRGRAAAGCGSAARGRSATRGRGRSAADKSVAPRKRRPPEEDSHGATSINAPSCNCPAPAAERTVTKDGANKGRRFFGCAKSREEACGFFAWADDQNRAILGPQTDGDDGPAPKRRAAPERQRSHVNINVGEERRCNCGLTPKQLTVSKEGPNQGRSFYKCPNVSKAAQCDFFVWADESEGGGAADTARTTGSGSGRGGAAGGGGGCFTCEEHWSRDCPAAGSRSVAGASARAGGAGKAGECYICHEDGHWSKDCPQRGGAGGDSRNGGSGSGGAASDYTCYKCGQQGHFASSCPDEGSSTSTRSRSGSARGGGARGGRGRGRARGRKKAAPSEWD